MQRLALIIPALAFVACSDDTTSPENIRPVSAFTYSCDELTCTFTDESYDEDGPLVTSIFTFGDGHESAAPDPTHTYQFGGAYTVLLVVQDLDGVKVGSEQVVRINSTPVVTILRPFDEQSFVVGAPITFEASGQDLESPVLSYAWFRNEAGKLTLVGNESVFTTSDLPVGRGVMRATATDGNGATASAEVEVLIEALPALP